MNCPVSSSVEVKDISLTDYIQIRHAVWLPHTAGRYAKKQFKKAQMPIVERLVDRCVLFGCAVLSFFLRASLADCFFEETASALSMRFVLLLRCHATIADMHCSLMMKGRNNGKKLLAVRIVAHAFEIIHLLTDQNPIQVRRLYSFRTAVPCHRHRH